jgi:hypothetical protein
MQSLCSAKETARVDNLQEGSREIDVHRLGLLLIAASGSKIIAFNQQSISFYF